MFISRTTAIAVCSFLVACVVGAAVPASAQFGGIGSRIRRGIEGAAADKVENVVRCALGDTACREKAKAEGKTVVDDPAAPAAAANAGGDAASAGKPGEGAWVNFDFVPGTRPLFVEDFTRDTVGDFPRRLEFVDGNMEVAEWRGARFLRVTSWPGTVEINLPETLPERFTVEFDATPGYNANWTIFKFADKAEEDVRFRLYGGKGQGGVFGPRHQQQGQTTSALAEGQVYRARIMADGRYVKVYMNDTRVANIPNADIGRSNKIRIEIPGTADSPAFVSNISVMAGGKKLYDALAETGRVATQGIYFDTGSDRIRPESTGTLKEIAAMLNEHPELKLSIEGHTDNTGNPQANQELSQRRAAAVVAFLTTSSKIDASRLSAAGLGDKNPVAPNTTPEGRQQNRRVELVKR